MAQRDTEGTIGWYRTHITTAQIGFNPNGMCLKVCRVARNIGPAFASALACQEATPGEFRVHDISKITRGMVMYFDDPNDSNPFGHIVTVMGRAKGFDRDDIRGIITRSNSIRSGLLTAARADYYPRYWNDRFVFAGEWLNGVVLDLPETKQKKQPKHPLLGQHGKKRLQKAIEIYDDLIEANERLGKERVVRALKRDRREIRETIKKKVR